MNANAAKFRWIEAVLADPKMSDRATRLASWLAQRFHSETLEIEISADTLGEDLGWRRAKVCRAIKELCAKWVDKGHGRFSNCYRPNFKHVEASHERLRINRERRREVHLERKARSFGQIPDVRQAKSDTCAVPKRRPIPCETPIVKSNPEEHPTERGVSPQVDPQSSSKVLFPAISDREAAEWALIKLLGQDDEARGLDLAILIPTAELCRLVDALRNGTLSREDVEQVVSSVVSPRGDTS